MSVHLPGSLEFGDWQVGPLEIDHTAAPLVDFITEDKVRLALSTFGKKKAAGPDGFKPVVLQHLNTLSIEVLTSIYKACIWTGYTPKLWREMDLIYLPKPNKTDYGIPKAYRPITLSNFLLKGLERICQWYMADTMPPLKSQHAYTRGLSTETALSEAVDFIEHGVLKKEYVIGVSLDCSGAFDNLNHNSMEAAMDSLDVPSCLKRWFMNILRERRISSTSQGETVRRKPVAGTSQGGVLSPVMWNIFINSVHDCISSAAVKAVIYADDMFLLLRGKDPNSMVDIMQKTVDEVNEWGKENGLTFNPSKTEAIIFTRKTTKVTWKPIKMNGQTLTYAKAVKYLGVTIDRSLTWTAHIESRIKLASTLINLSKAAVGQSWGLTPDKVHGVYTAIIQPVLAYGSLVFAHALTDSHRLLLKGIHRRIMLSMTHSMRSTPTDGMEVVLGLLPLDLYIAQTAAMATWRIGTAIQWDGLDESIKGRKSHRKFWGDFHTQEGVEGHTDRITRTNEWTNFDRIDPAEETTKIYTDGSKLEDGTAGAGFAIFQGDHIVAEESFRLDDHATVFQAEVVAIERALMWTHSHSYEMEGDCAIFSDSQAAIGALNTNFVVSEAVLGCKLALATVQKDRKIGLSWVKGHANNTGNEHADMLAKTGCGTDNVVHVGRSTASVRSQLKTHFAERWKKRWGKSKQCQQTRQMYPVPNKETKKLLKLSKKRLNLLMQIATGHGLFKKHLAQWRRGMEETCSLCLETEETPWHILKRCPALERERWAMCQKSEGSEIPEKTLIRFFEMPSIAELMSSNAALLE